MRRVEIIDEYWYMNELEKSQPRFIKEKIVRKKIETPKEIIKPKEWKEINPIYRFNKDGDLVDKYINPKQMAKKLNWREYYVRIAASEERQYNGFILTMKHYTKEQFLERFRKPKKAKIEKVPRPKKERIIKPKKEKVPYIQICTIYQYNKDGELVATYINCGDAAKKTNWKRSTIKTYSKLEKAFNGFLLSRTQYTKEEAKQRYQRALNEQQTTFVYKDGELVATCSTLDQVMTIINTDIKKSRLTYCKMNQVPINGYVISSKQILKTDI